MEVLTSIEKKMMELVKQNLSVTKKIISMSLSFFKNTGEIIKLKLSNQFLKKKKFLYIHKVTLQICVEASRVKIWKIKNL